MKSLKKDSLNHNNKVYFNIFAVLFAIHFQNNLYMISRPVLGEPSGCGEPLQVFFI